MDAAGIAPGRAARAAPPGIPCFSLRISIAKPLRAGFSVKIIDGWLPADPFGTVLNEIWGTSQCQKRGSRGDLTGASDICRVGKAGGREAFRRRAHHLIPHSGYNGGHGA